MQVNYKNSLFVTLFNNAPSALELYNAVASKRLGAGTAVTMNTLEDVLYQGIKNDISFLIGDVVIVLIEHQSSLNPNMPLRLLLYIARLYERLISNKEFHRRKLLKIPRPFFLVLYNGRELLAQDRMVLRLSDAFKDFPGALGKLELEVPVLNINPGHNQKLLARSPLLSGYMTFVVKARENERSMPAAQAILSATDYCIEQNILADFFKEHRLEVSNMILNEVTNEDALQARWEDGREDGQEKIGDQLLALIDQGYTAERLKELVQNRSPLLFQKPSMINFP